MSVRTVLKAASLLVLNIAFILSAQISPGGRIAHAANILPKDELYPASSDPITIGVYMPLSGDSAAAGRKELVGIRLANMVMPSVLGRPVNLVVVNNQSDAAEAVQAVRRLIEREGAVAVIGSYGSPLSTAGAEVAEKAKVPCVGTYGTNPQVTSGKKYYFRACFTDPYQGAAAARYAYETLGARKAAVLVDRTNDYTIGLCKAFMEAFRKFGGEIVAEPRYRTGDREFSEQLKEVGAKKADLLFMPVHLDEGVRILRQAREMKVAFRLMGSNAMDNPNLLKEAGRAVEGFVHTAFPYDPDMPGMPDAARRFTDEWNRSQRSVRADVESALGYTAYALLLDAIRRAGAAEPAAITRALAATKDFQSIFGQLAINGNHDAEFPVGVMEYRDGRRRYLGGVRP